MNGWAEVRSAGRRLIVGLRCANPTRHAGGRLLARVGAALMLCLPPMCSAGELRPFVAESMKALRAELSGRPFVLALWSVTCEPCREELGHWVAWQRKHPGVPIVLVSTDPPEDRAAVAALLARHDLGRVQTWAFNDEYVERVRHAIDTKWRGELPRTYFFDASHRAEARSGLLDWQWAESWLAKSGDGKPGLPGPAKP